MNTSHFEVMLGRKVEGYVDSGVHSALRSILRVETGVRDIRVLHASARQGTRHKAFIIFDAVDIERDLRLVRALDQFDELDFDIVHTSALSMIPPNACSISN